MSWVGFTSTDREGALKLLTISASAGQDVHSAFAALTLLTFYGLILLRKLSPPLRSRQRS